jgi:hypothetical protein
MTTTAFALYTRDAAWIARNHGIAGPSGRVLVQVPADQVEKVTLGGHAHLRHRFADVPKDAGNAHIMCPAIWVETPEVTAGRPEALDGKALFLARMRGER